MISLSDLIYALPKLAGSPLENAVLIQRHCGGTIIKSTLGANYHYHNNLDGVWVDVSRKKFGKRAWPYRSIVLDYKVTAPVDELEEKVLELLSWM